MTLGRLKMSPSTCSPKSAPFFVSKKISVLAVSAPRCWSPSWTTRKTRCAKRSTSVRRFFVVKTGLVVRRLGGTFQNVSKSSLWDRPQDVLNRWESNHQTWGLCHLPSGQSKSLLQWSLLCGHSPLGSSLSGSQGTSLVAKTCEQTTIHFFG